VGQNYLKIVMITSQWLQTKGGPSSHVSNLALQLREMGHQVWILSAEQGDGAIHFSNKPFQREFDIFRLLMQKKPDIVHLHGRMHYIAPALAYKLFFGRNSRLVFTFHTQPYVKDFLVLQDKGNRDYIGVQRIIAKWLIHRCDEVVTCSHSLIFNLNKYYNMDIRKYTVLYTGAELSLIDKEKQESFKKIHNLKNCHPILAGVGVFSWDWKVAGHQVCIEAVNLLKKKYPSVKLLIAGRGRFEEYLVGLVRDYKLEDHVTFLGYTDCMREFLASSDIYVHMAMHEAMGLSVVEAMHAMKPIIVANRGGLPEIIEHNVNGLVIEPNAEELFRAVDWLIQHEEERQRIANNAFTFASKFLTLEYFSSRIQSLYIEEH